MTYTMALIIEGREIGIPVLPDKLEITSPGKNDKAVVIALGEVLILRKKGLRSVAWDSHFPACDAPYVTGKVSDPLEAVKAIQAARDADPAQPIRFLLTGTDLDINMRVGVDSFDYEERGGEVGDIYYDIKLMEWKDYAPKRIILPTAPPTAAAPATAQEVAPERPADPPAPSKTHTVIKGDSLWAIAQRHYGNGSRYPDIYAANQPAIDGRNKGTGNSKYTIYPGQVFTLP